MNNIFLKSILTKKSMLLKTYKQTFVKNKIVKYIKYYMKNQFKGGLNAFLETINNNNNMIKKMTATKVKSEI